MSKLNFIKRVLTIAVAQPCVICQRRLAVNEETLCTSCNISLARTWYETDPYNNEMAKLLWGRIDIEKCVALLYFRSGAKESNIIYRLKYAKKPEFGEHLGRLMASVLLKSDFFRDIDVILPLPLAKEKIKQRGYNQSEEIAWGMHLLTHIPIINNAVIRKKNTETQTNKNRWQRNENVKDAFELVRTKDIKGKHVLLVDDIFTTGATVCACAYEICKAKGVKLSVCTLGIAK